jgi:hypothetical protein
MEKIYTLDAQSGIKLKSKVINSSKLMKKQPQISDQWDKLETFARKKREKLQQPQPTAKRPEFTPFQILQDLKSMLSKEAILGKLDSQKLLKIFLVSSLLLLIQFSLSKRTRYWLYNTFHILLYIAGFLLSTGSLGIVAMKFFNQVKDHRHDKKAIEDHKK